MAADDTLYTELQNAGSVTVTPASDWQMTSCGDAVSVPVTDGIPPQAMKEPESFRDAEDKAAMGVMSEAVAQDILERRHPDTFVFSGIQHPDGRRDTLTLGVDPEIPVTDEMIADRFHAAEDVMLSLSHDDLRIVYRAMDAFVLGDEFDRARYEQALMERELWAGKFQEACTLVNDKDREIAALRAERDLWKGLHGDLVAKFSATTPAPEPADGLAYDSQGRAFPAYSTHTLLLPVGPVAASKPAPEHDPFRDFSGDPRRMGR